MPYFRPDKFVHHITDIDVKRDMLDRGLRHALIDVDNTIFTRDTHEVPANVRLWIGEAKRLGVSICLLSNNFHDSVLEVAKDLKLPIVSHAVKPLFPAFLVALNKIGAKRKNTVMIGDQVITDVLGAHGLGIKAYMVLPLVKKDLTHTLILRNLEKLMLRGMKPEPTSNTEAAKDNCNLYLIGRGIAHSKSRVMYLAAFKACGINWNYENAPLGTAEAAIDFLQNKKFVALNATTPYKPECLQAADEATPEARAANGASAIIANPETGLSHAYNFDGEGACIYLQKQGAEFTSRNVVIFGTGVTAMSIAYACANRGAKSVVLVCRNVALAQPSFENLQQAMSENLPQFNIKNLTCIEYSKSDEEVASANIVINATTLGMKSGDDFPMGTHVFNKNQFVLDCIYGHGQTDFISKATKAKATCFDGRGMLAAQGSLFFMELCKVHGIKIKYSREEIYRIIYDCAFE